MAKITNEVLFNLFTEIHNDVKANGAKLDRIEAKLNGITVPTTNPVTTGKGASTKTTRPKKSYTVDGKKYNLIDGKYDEKQYYTKAEELGYTYKKSDGTTKVYADRRGHVYLALGWLTAI